MNVAVNQTRLQNTQAIEKVTPKPQIKLRKPIKEANPSTLQDWCDCQAEISARTGLAQVINWQHAPAGVTVREKTTPVEFTNGKYEKEQSRSRSGMVRLNKSLTLKKSEPQALIKQAETKINRKDKTNSNQCLPSGVANLLER